MYTPKDSEWPACGRDEECERIIHGMEAIMEHSMAEPFLTPVDLNAFPLYGFVIEYPMDLSTIKARLENHFYRYLYIHANCHLQMTCFCLFYLIYASFIFVLVVLKKFINTL